MAWPPFSVPLQRPERLRLEWTAPRRRGAPPRSATGLPRLLAAVDHGDAGEQRLEHDATRRHHKRCHSRESARACTHLGEACGQSPGPLTLPLPASGERGAAAPFFPSPRVLAGRGRVRGGASSRAIVKMRASPSACAGMTQARASSVPP